MRKEIVAFTIALAIGLGGTSQASTSSKTSAGGFIKKALFLSALAAATTSITTPVAATFDNCDCNNVNTETCLADGAKLSFLGSTPTDSFTTYNYKMCTGSDLGCNSGPAHDPSHITLDYPSCSGWSAVDISRTSGPSATCYLSEEDQTCDIFSPNAKCDFESFSSGNCYTFSVKVTADKDKQELGSVFFGLKSSTACFKTCIKGPVCKDEGCQTSSPTKAPTFNPTGEPTSKAPTYNPTKTPTKVPTINPTGEPTSKAPTYNPTKTPTKVPTINPTGEPTSKAPTYNPTQEPTNAPTQNPTQEPTNAPTFNPTKAPTKAPTFNPTGEPTSKAPTYNPTQEPTNAPNQNPTQEPTYAPTFNPTKTPTKAPTFSPTGEPTSKTPTYNPTQEPTNAPNQNPTQEPTYAPTFNPTKTPTKVPTFSPTGEPTYAPTYNPTQEPTNAPNQNPTLEPTSKAPTFNPTKAPTKAPTFNPTGEPTSKAPTYNPTQEPTYAPNQNPTLNPTKAPTKAPTFNPTGEPASKAPTYNPTQGPTNAPNQNPTLEPTSKAPTFNPTKTPTKAPTFNPTGEPTSKAPTYNPTQEPTNAPNQNPTSEPTKTPTFNPTNNPTYAPTTSAPATFAPVAQDQTRQPTSSCPIPTNTNPCDSYKTNKKTCEARNAIIRRETQGEKYCVWNGSKSPTRCYYIKARHWDPNVVKLLPEGKGCFNNFRPAARVEDNNNKPLVLGCGEASDCLRLGSESCLTKWGNNCMWYPGNFIADGSNPNDYNEYCAPFIAGTPEYADCTPLKAATCTAQPNCQLRKTKCVSKGDCAINTQAACNADSSCQWNAGCKSQYDTKYLNFYQGNVILDGDADIFKGYYNWIIENNLEAQRYMGAARLRDGSITSTVPVKLGPNSSLWVGVMPGPEFHFNMPAATSDLTVTLLSAPEDGEELAVYHIEREDVKQDCAKFFEWIQVKSSVTGTVYVKFEGSGWIVEGAYADAQKRPFNPDVLRKEAGI